MPPGQCYLEVGTFQGKSLVSALLGNTCQAVACDTFAESFPGSENTEAILRMNIERHGLAGRVRFFNEDFRSLLADWQTRTLPPVGLYFYDGAHDHASQYDGIRLAEYVLADEAVVLVDDWRFAPDSQSYAAAATMQAVKESRHRWQLHYELPARWNGDTDAWWNGVAVLTFQRT